MPTIDINYCSGCPFHASSPGEGDAASYKLCIHRRTGCRDLPNYPAIPDWCPLHAKQPPAPKVPQADRLTEREATIAKESVRLFLANDKHKGCVPDYELFHDRTDLVSVYEMRHLRSIVQDLPPLPF